VTIAEQAAKTENYQREKQAARLRKAILLVRDHPGHKGYAELYLAVSKEVGR
jgi:hypothetical protein